MVAATAVAAAMLLQGCDLSSWFPPKLEPAELEQRILAHVSEHKRPPPRSAKCPRKLTAKVGDSVLCAVVSAEGDRYQYRFTTRVHRGAHMEMDMLEIWQTIPAYELDKTIAEMLAKRGQPVKQVNCPKALSGPVGNAMDCPAVDAAGEAMPVRLSVLEVGADASKMRYQVITAATRARLQDSVREALNAHGAFQAASVQCESALGEHEGDLVHCVAIDGNGRRAGLTVKTGRRDPETQIHNFEFRLDDPAARPLTAARSHKTS
ncbi:MAG: DUF4333 domain-containing protein [Lysobacter sp.]|nr:DUF4333 domain-containing protein [Lysobacter sp.]